MSGMLIFGHYAARFEAGAPGFTSSSPWLTLRGVPGGSSPRGNSARPLDQRPPLARRGNMHLSKKALVVLLGVPLLLITACSSSSSSSSSGTTTTSASGSCGYTFAVITHGDNGSFWSVVYKGAKDAAATLGCKLSEVYGSQQQGQAEPDDNAENAQIEDAINAHVNGIAVSDHDPALMNATIAKAIAAGIPVVMLNAGCDPTDLAATKAITCVGQPEQVAGQQAGAQFKSEGETNVLCVIHQSGQNLLDRCNGIAQALGAGSTCSTGSAPKSGPGCTEL